MKISQELIEQIRNINLRPPVTEQTEYSTGYCDGMQEALDIVVEFLETEDNEYVTGKMEQANALSRHAAFWLSQSPPIHIPYIREQAL